MGKDVATAIVFVGCLALISSSVSLAAPGWLVEDETKSYGLWMTCTKEKICTTFKEPQTPHMNAIRGLVFVGVCFQIIAILFTYLQQKFHFVGKTTSKMESTPTLLKAARSSAFIVAIVSLATAAAIFTGITDDKGNALSYGFSYYLCWASSGFSFVATLISLSEH